MAKNNIRSIRFSDDLAKLIEQQVGDTFTQKFESLIYRAFWELPEKERELEEINRKIYLITQRLRALEKAEININAINNLLNNTKQNIKSILHKAEYIAQEVEKAET